MWPGNDTSAARQPWMCLWFVETVTANITFGNWAGISEITRESISPGYDAAKPQWFDQSEPEIVSLKDV